ncbi:dihydrofolate reductase [Robiginitalea sp. SC105]|uniref:dihydrofolate reductase n=1 Tax=Robiginitalea sp. SC105 TaxID=2762332 RepID=UPI00163A0445|nr:dihydrofolate reductase [Robiginitalea sp. SC105]MBC2838910.1 dihydrofolate reductase [Robiginitalea sp. SC105]
MKEVILIAAAGEKNELGRDANLPWHLPDDFKRFKELTTGHPMVMGRKTFETFPKPLPGRRHIIITRDREYRVDHPACTVVHSLEAALDAAADAGKVFVIGGGEIYRLALPKATKIELTRVHGRFEADTYFPEFDAEQWELIASRHHPADERHNFAFTYYTLVRKD